MSTPTLAEVLSPILADMRIKAANLRQGAPRIAEFADVAYWIDGWELAIATAAQNVGTSTPETATPEELAALNMAINRLPHACWEGKPACSTCSDAVTALRSLRERLALTPEPTEPERVNTLGGSRVSAMPILALWLETTADACEGEPNSDAFNLRTSATLLRSLHAERDDAIAACERLQQRIVRLEGLIERDEPGLEDLLADSDRLQQRVRELERHQQRVLEAVREVGRGHWDAPRWNLHVPAAAANRLFDIAYNARAEEKGTNA